MLCECGRCGKDAAGLHDLPGSGQVVPKARVKPEKEKDKEKEHNYHVKMAIADFQVCFELSLYHMLCVLR